MTIFRSKKTADTLFNPDKSAAHGHEIDFTKPMHGSGEKPTRVLPDAKIPPSGDMPTVVFNPLGEEPKEPNKVPIPSRGPVVGWLVIIQGPGQGRSFELTYNRNRIGRGKENEVNLDFGEASDQEISRNNHATIAHNKKTQKFSLVPGENYPYIGDQQVLSAIELAPRCVFELGQTQLSFVPFCDEHFDWQGKNA